MSDVDVDTPSDSETSPCERCGTLTDRFVNVEPGMRLALQTAGTEGTLPDRVCPSCFDSLTGSVSQGLKLRMEREVRDKNKMMMWKNRVHLIKNARILMSQKAYSEAAVQYEKYIRVLEVVHNLKKGELTPATFNNSTRSKELTVIASVYWDLMRIYDNSPRYGDRMQASAQKCSEFLPFSTIYPDIVRKAEQFMRSAKNPNVLREFLRLTKSSRGPCFVASAAFADEPLAVELFILRRYRDTVLRPTYLGRKLILAYYHVSPPLARWVGRSQLKSRIARWLITKITALLKKSLISS